MTEALYVLLGAFVAVMLDWAIYTHLSAYLRIGIPRTPNCSYREIALDGSRALLRTVAIAAIGGAAGFALGSRQGSFWLITVGMFVVGHSALYALLYKRRRS